MLNIVQIISGFVLVLTCFAQAQAQAPLEERRKQFNAGTGFSNRGALAYASFDFRADDNITVGPEVSFRRYKENYEDLNGNPYDFRHSIIAVGVNGNYHFNAMLNIPSYIDFYTGLTFAYFLWLSPSDYLGFRGSDIGMTGQIGGRYFLSDGFAINAQFEVGTIMGGKVGITYKLPLSTVSSY